MQTRHFSHLMNFVVKHIFLLILVSCATVQAQSLNQSPKPTYGGEVSATGLAYVEYFYEEAGYGDSPEKDRIVGACMLKLDRQMSLTNSSSVKSIHLIFTRDNRNKCQALQGKRVHVKGTLMEVHTGHHHGDVLLDVKNYQILRD